MPKKSRHSHSSHHRAKPRTVKRRSRSRSPARKSRKRPLNEFFKKMLKAKKSGAKEFTYKPKGGITKTYVRKISKSPKSGVELVVYKQQKRK
jgi:hypothetical protein